MAVQQNRDAGRNAVALLATAVVLLFGAAACAFLILTAVDRPGWPLAGAAAFFTLFSIVLFTWGTRSEQPRERQGLLAWLRGRETVDPCESYRPHLRKPQSQDFGTIAPPSVESVREAAEDFVRWVPHSSVEECRRPAHNPRQRG